MDRITSTTKSGIFVEAMCRIDIFENNRIALYKGLNTANRITISYDFSTNLISITAILPIDFVDISKQQGSLEYVSFFSSNSVQVSYGAIVGDTESGGGGGGVIEYASYPIESIAYASAFNLVSVDNSKSEPKKNIQITLDEPNSKAIIDATIPFRHYLNNSGAIETQPLDQ